MRWAHPVASGGVGSGLDRLEPIPALRVGVLNGEAFEVGVERGRVRVTRMGVAPVGVRLPQLDFRALHRLRLHVHDATHDIDHLARGASGLTRQGSQIGGLLHRSEDRVERSENFAWSPSQGLGERRTDGTGQGDAACRNRHPQNVRRDSARSSLMARLPSMSLPRLQRDLHVNRSRYWIESIRRGNPKTDRAIHGLSGIH